MLLDFNVLLDREICENDLLILGRRGEALHDTYWCCSSNSDDKMAGMFGQVILKREKGWSGIHHELAKHVEECGLNVISTQAASQDFTEFGDYSPAQRQEMITGFLSILTSDGAVSVRGISTEFNALTTACLKKACSMSLGESDRQKSSDLVKRVSSLIKNADLSEQGWSAMPTVSLLNSADESLPDDQRVINLLFALLYDALTNSPALALRCRAAPNLLNDLISNFIVALSAFTSTPKAPRDKISRLWRERLDFYSSEEIQKAYSLLCAQFTNNTESRSMIADFLEVNGKPDEFIKFAELYLQSYPDRRNAHTLMAQARRFAEAAGAAKAVGGA